MNPDIDVLVRERILTFLIPLFLHPANGDVDRARQAVEAMLQSYDPRTTRELRLAAMNIAFSLGALDALARSVSPDATISQVLRLRSGANALARSAERADQALQAEKADPCPDQEADAPLPDSVDPQALVAFARTNPPMSRQQRRLAERQQEKQRRRQEEEMMRRAQAFVRQSLETAAAV